MTLNALVDDDELHIRTDAERASERVLLPFHQFARWQAYGALLLLVCAVGALLWANSPGASTYDQILHVPLSLSFDASAIRTLAFPVPLGIMAGLVLGKPAGIFLASWLAVKAGLATLPEGVSWRHVYGTACLAGIGFTMALFISGLAFPGTGLESQAKLGILLGSLMSAGVGIAILLGTQRVVETLPQ